MKEDMRPGYLTFKISIKCYKIMDSKPFESYFPPKKYAVFVQSAFTQFTK